MELKGEKISKKQITLDGNSFVDCEISDSVLVYKGGVLPVLRDCKINDCQWNFSDQAANTLQFLAAMYNGMGMGGMDIVDQTIVNIRNNTLVSPQQAAQLSATEENAANEANVNQEARDQGNVAEQYATEAKPIARKKSKSKAKANSDAA
ncbi:MAG: hypothetical protein AB8B48_11955 [Pseudomonadales bacterium]